MRKRSSDQPDEVSPEWTVEDFHRARPLLEVLPKETADALRRFRGQRGPQKAPTKELISLRLDRDVVAALRATGFGWQTRANDALRAAYVTGPVPGTRATTARRRAVAKRRSSTAKRRA
jgi:uncharacterized protein (DUF4415 family)